MRITLENNCKPNYYQVDDDHDLSDLMKMGLVTDYASFCTGNIFKYVYRYRDKNGLEDLKKARVYLDKLIEFEYGEDSR